MKEKPQKRQYIGDEEYLKRKKERNKALREAFEKDHPQARAGGGSDLDAEIAALQARVTKLEESDAEQDQRLAALEEGGGTEPEPPEPEPPEPEPGDKNWPDADDPMCGVPAGTSLQTTGAMTLSQDGAKLSGRRSRAGSPSPATTARSSTARSTRATGGRSRRRVRTACTCTTAR
jgi:hypothetical protein